MHVTLDKPIMCNCTSFPLNDESKIIYLSCDNCDSRIILTYEISDKGGYWLQEFRFLSVGTRSRLIRSARVKFFPERSFVQLNMSHLWQRPQQSCYHFQRCSWQYKCTSQHQILLSLVWGGCDWKGPWPSRSEGSKRPWTQDAIQPEQLCCCCHNDNCKFISRRWYFSVTWLM